MSADSVTQQSSQTSSMSYGLDQKPYVNFSNGMMFAGVGPGFPVDHTGNPIPIPSGTCYRTRGPHPYRIFHALNSVASEFPDEVWDSRHENRPGLLGSFYRAIRETLVHETDLERPSHDAVRGSVLSLTMNHNTLPRGVSHGDTGFFKEATPTMSDLPKAEILFSTDDSDSLVISGIEITIDGTAEDLDCPHDIVSLKPRFVQTHAKKFAAGLKYIQSDLRALSGLDQSYDANYDQVLSATENTIKYLASDLKHRLIHYELEERDVDRERPEGSRATERSRPVETEDFEN
jgi:hypothetical protein